MPLVRLFVLLWCVADDCANQVPYGQPWDVVHIRVWRKADGEDSYAGVLGAVLGIVPGKFNVAVGSDTPLQEFPSAVCNPGYAERLDGGWLRVPA